MRENFTESQRLAVELRGGSVLVSAAAGSGKTSVLTERVVSLLCGENPVDADRILVVTYTRAAAEEVSFRIKRRLLELAAERPGDPLVRRQLSLIKRARISTVHAFCTSLLKEHFSSLDIPPDFSVADESTAAALRERAMDSTLETMYSDYGERFRALCDLFGRSRSDDEVPKTIEALFDFYGLVPYPDEWENFCRAELTRAFPRPSRIGAYLVGHASSALASCKRLLGRALGEAESDGEIYAKYASALQSDLRFVSALGEALEKGDWDRCVELVSGFKFEGLGQYRGQNKACAKRIRALRNRVKGTADDLKKDCFCFTSDDFRAAGEFTGAHLETLFLAQHVFSRELMSLKLEKRALEFCDLERLALTLLTGEDGGPSDTALAVRDELDCILVDEYQDTNAVQDMIFKLVSRDESNLFFVGDIKQSIYGFRSADPKIFSDRLAAGGEAGGFPRNLFLSENFRSCPAVIEGINAVFGGIMTAANGGVDYTGGEVLRCGTKQPPFSGEMCVEIVRSDKLRDEARCIAHRIRRMLDDKTPVFGRDGVPRPCAPGDFAVIMRSPARRTEAFLDELAALGIPAGGAESDNLFEASEVACVVSLLRAADNPLRDVDVAAAALSPLFALTPDDLAEAKAGARRAPLFSRLLTLSCERARRFCDAVKGLRNLAARSPVSELLRYINDAYNAELLLCAGPDLDRRLANLRSFYARAADSDARGTTLGEFLAVCENARKKGLVRCPPARSAGSEVRIVSAHGAKGLEWPIVFVVDADKPFNTQDSYQDSVLFSRTLGAGMRVRLGGGGDAPMYKKKLPAYNALSLEKRSAAVGEEMRILYVALTRARERLFIIGRSAKPEELPDKFELFGRGKLDEYMVGRCKSWLDWVLLASAAAPGGELTRALEGEARLGPCAIRVVEPPEQSKPVQAPPLPPPDPDDVAQLADIAAHPPAAGASYPLRVSVSDLVKETRSERIEQPSFARGEMLPYEKGSAMHAFMQYADYAAASRDLEGEIERLTAREFLSPEQADALDRDALRTLFAGELGRFITANADSLMREYPFFDTLPAREIDPLAGEGDTVLVQGVADCVVPVEGGVVLVDYKTDNITDIAVLGRVYARQIELYRRAVHKRLGLPVLKSVVYSFALGGYVEL